MFLSLSADIIFSTLTTNIGKQLKLQKRSQNYKSSYPSFVSDQKLFMTFFYKLFLYTNYILMFIMKRSISTRGFKNLALKF